MTWLVAIVMAVIAFGGAVFLFRLPTRLWTALAAALVFGLAGYTFQASPDVASAPRASVLEVYEDQWQMIETREALVDPALNSRTDSLLQSDAFARRGQFSDAAGFLRNALADNPDDFEAWLALGNVLSEQTGGALTQASVYAYSQADRIAPQSPAPDYFLGLSLIRQGRMMEAREVWRSGVLNADPEAQSTQLIMERLGRLDEMLSRAGAVTAAE